MENSASNRTILITFALVVVAIIVGGVLLVITRPEPVQITIIPPEPTATPLPTPTPQPITVYVTGAVIDSQQTVTLPAGSRVQDAIDAAGGIIENADLVRVNLADLLRDGDQVHVPALDEGDTLGGAGIVDTTEAVRDELNLATPIGGEIVRINSATFEEIITLPGIGEVTAERILTYRDENGPFTSIEDLDAVSGIGPATLENLAPLLIFD